MKRDPVYCASCDSFPLAACIENEGKALCASFETRRAWNDPACVLHNDAPDRKARKPLVVKLMSATNQNDKKGTA